MIPVSAKFKELSLAGVSEPQFKLQAILTDVASKNLGGQAYASDQFSADFPASGANDGKLDHLNFGPAATSEDGIGLAGWKSASSAIAISRSTRADWNAGDQNRVSTVGAQVRAGIRTFGTYFQDFELLPDGSLGGLDGWTLAVGQPGTFTIETDQVILGKKSLRMDAAVTPSAWSLGEADRLLTSVGFRDMDFSFNFRAQSFGHGIPGDTLTVRIDDAAMGSTDYLDLQCLLYDNGGNPTSCRWRAATSTQSTPTTTPILTGETVRLKATIRGTTVSFYCDGLLIGTMPITWGVNFLKYIHIYWNVFNPPAGFVPGIIDDISVRPYFGSYSEDCEDRTLGLLVGQDGWTSVSGAGTISVVNTATSGFYGQSIEMNVDSGSRQIYRDLSPGFPHESGFFAWKMNRVTAGSVVGINFSYIRLRLMGSGSNRIDFFTTSQAGLPLYFGSTAAPTLLTIPNNDVVGQTRDYVIDWRPSLVVGQTRIRLWLDGSVVDEKDIAQIPGIDRLVLDQVKGIGTTGPVARIENLRFGISLMDSGTEEIEVDFGTEPVSKRIQFQFAGETRTPRSFIRDAFYTITNNDTAISFRRATAPLRVFVGQTFTPADDGPMDEASVELIKVGAPVGSVWMEIRDTSAGFAIGQALATSVFVNCANISTTAAVYRFRFPTPWFLKAGRTYAWSLAGSYTLSDTVYIALRNDSSAPTYAGGSLCYSDNGTAWTNVTSSDVGFAIYCNSNLVTHYSSTNQDGMMAVGASAAESRLSLGFELLREETIERLRVYLRKHEGAIFPSSAYIRAELRSDDGSGGPSTTIIAKAPGIPLSKITWGGTEASPVFEYLAMSLTKTAVLSKGVYHLILIPSWTGTSVNHLDIGVDLSGTFGGYVAQGTDLEIWTKYPGRVGIFSMIETAKPRWRFDSLFQTAPRTWVPGSQDLISNGSGAASGGPVELVLPGSVIRNMRVRAIVDNGANICGSPSLSAYLSSWTLRSVFAYEKILTVSLSQKRTLSAIEVIAHPLEGGARKFSLDYSTLFLDTWYDANMGSGIPEVENTIVISGIKSLGFKDGVGIYTPFSVNGESVVTAGFKHQRQPTGSSTVVLHNEILVPYTPIAVTIAANGDLSLSSTSGSSTLPGFVDSNPHSYALEVHDIYVTLWFDGSPVLTGFYQGPVLHRLYLQSTGTISGAYSGIFDDISVLGYLQGFETTALGDIRYQTDNWTTLTSFSNLEARKRNGEATATAENGIITTDGDMVSAYLSTDITDVAKIRIRILDNIDEWARVIELRAFRVIDFGPRVLGDPTITQQGDFVQRSFKARNLSLSLDNSDGFLSPLGTNGGFNSELGEGMRMIFWVGFSEAVDYVRIGEFFVDNWKENPHTATINLAARDLVKRADIPVETKFKSNKGAHEVFEYLMNKANIPSQIISADKVANVIGYFAPAELNAYQESKKIAEGCGYAQVQVDRDGRFVFRTTGLTARDARAPGYYIGYEEFRRTEGPIVYLNGKYYALIWSVWIVLPSTFWYGWKLAVYDPETYTWTTTLPGFEEAGGFGGSALFAYDGKLYIFFKGKESIYVWTPGSPTWSTLATYKAGFMDDLSVDKVFFQEDNFVYTAGSTVGDVLGHTVKRYDLRTGQVELLYIDTAIHSVIGGFNNIFAYGDRLFVEAVLLYSSIPTITYPQFWEVDRYSGVAVKIGEADPGVDSRTNGIAVDPEGRAWFINCRRLPVYSNTGKYISAILRTLDLNTFQIVDRWRFHEKNAIRAGDRNAIVYTNGLVLSLGRHNPSGDPNLPSYSRLMIYDVDRAVGISPGPLSHNTTIGRDLSVFDRDGIGWIYGLFDAAKIFELRGTKPIPNSTGVVLELKDEPDSPLVSSSIDHGADMGGENRIINIVTVKSNPYAPYGAEALWNADGLPWNISEKMELVFRVKLKDPGTALAPTMVVDPVGAATISIETQGIQPEVKINVTAPCRITALGIGGTPLRKEQTFVASFVGKGSSVERYGPRNKVIENDYVYDYLSAVPLGTWILLANQDNKAKAEGVAAVAQWYVELFDEVHLVDSRTGLDASFYVTGYSHRYRSQKSTFTLNAK